METEKEEKKDVEKTRRTRKEEPAINSQEYVDLMIERKRKVIKIASIAAAVIIVLLLSSTIFALSAMTSSKIISGVTIDFIDVSGLDKTQACALLEEKLKNKQEATIKLKYQDYEKDIVLEELELTSNIEEVVDQALNKGRDKNIFINNLNVMRSKFRKQNIDLNVNYNDEVLNRILIDINTELPGIVTDYTYSIEENELVITKGTDGIILDRDGLKNQITEELTDLSRKITTDVQLPIREQKAGEIDLDAIYAEIYTEPQDAYIVEEPFQVVVDKDGIDFAISMEEAKALLKEEKEEYIIPLKVTKAQKTVASLGSRAFPDQLANFTTRYDAGIVGRTTNLKIATGKLNGYVLQPGEIFSYNKALGKRTVENGYKEAAVYANGGVENGIGGGICQISTTLYNAVLEANLEIVERHNHSFVTSYSDPGKDATVVYGVLDFKFKNTRKYPIKIESYIKGGVATVNIYGLKEDPEYTVKVTSSVIANIPCPVETIEDPTLPEGTEVVVTKGTNGCKSVTYKYVYTKSGELVSKTQLSADTYGTIKRTVKVGTKKAEQTPPPEPVDPVPSPSPEPSVPVDPTPSPSPEPSVPVDPTPSPSPEPSAPADPTPTPPEPAE